MSFWGGGIDSQHTLPAGSLDAIRSEVGKTVPILAKNSGYVFANIHNLLADISPEKVIALYRAAAAEYKTN